MSRSGRVEVLRKSCVECGLMMMMMMMMICLVSGVDYIGSRSTRPPVATERATQEDTQVLTRTNQQSQ